jgi:uncharacterized membrane protein
MPAWRLVAAAAALAAYALASHALMVHAPAEPWAVAALFGPLLAAAALGAWQRRHAPALVGCVGAAALLAAVVARGGLADTQRLYVLQHAAIHLVLAWTFGSTLREGATPLVSALAERVHRQFTPAMRAYTRALTRLWTLYFVAMVGVSFTIYALAPWPWWSLFCNLLTPLAAVGLFVGEYAWRRRRHPEFEPASLAAAWRAYRTRADAARAGAQG